MKLFITFFLFLFRPIVSCQQDTNQVWADGLPISRDTISITALGRIDSGVLLVKDTIDLGNKTCHIPAGITLKFCGGYIKNGTLVGDMTKLKSCRPCFYHVKIQGSWNMPVIKSSLFDDLSYDNALKDVIALSHPTVKNKILIWSGYYQLSALGNNDVCLSINSNTELVLNGTIQMAPNPYRCYNIVQIEGNNINISGKGIIVGDKHTHTGKSGEWGMGIRLKQAHDVKVSGLTVKDCWGDCIYVGDGSTNVIIERCKLDHGRRQGISITSADGILVRDCEITNVSGTLPEFAIDVEPNENDTVDRIVVDNVHVSGCNGGLKAVRYANNTRIGSVIVRNCSISSIEYDALRFVRCEKVIIEKNQLMRINDKPVLDCNSVKWLTIKDNAFFFGKKTSKRMRSIIKRLVLGESNDVVKTISCENVVAKDNTKSKIRK